MNKEVERIFEESPVDVDNLYGLLYQLSLPILKARDDSLNQKNGKCPETCERQIGSLCETLERALSCREETNKIEKTLYFCPKRLG